MDFRKLVLWYLDHNCTNVLSENPSFSYVTIASKMGSMSNSENFIWQISGFMITVVHFKRKENDIVPLKGITTKAGARVCKPFNLLNDTQR